MKVSLNMMVRDEPYAQFGLMSILDYVDEALVCDTGSTDGTFEELQELTAHNPKIKLSRVNLANAHGWVQSDLDKTVEWSVSTPLGDVRRKLHNDSQGEIIWLLDGDEVYYDGFAAKVKWFIDYSFHNELDCVCLPFVDLTSDGKYVRHWHHMGRLFRRDTTEVCGGYPIEMHRAKGSNVDLAPGQHNVKLFCPTTSMKDRVLHFESVVKPWRKPQNKMFSFNEYWPEVFDKMESNRVNVPIRK